MRITVTRNETLLILLCAVFLIANVFMVSPLTEHLKSDVRYTASEQETLQKSALAALVRELRMGVGDILWLKTDEYIHSGVMYREMTPEEILREEKKSDTHEHAENHVHEHEEGDARDNFNLGKAMGYDEEHAHQVKTVIPGERKDFRGFLGEFERAVKPYSPTHVPHKEMEEMIPWYRLITYANPHHVRAYTVGAYFIYAYGNQPDAALQFLEEGEHNNPDSPKIKEALGRMYLYKFDKPAKAIPYYRDSVRLFEEKSMRTSLSDEEQELHRNAYVSMVLSYIELDKPEKALDMYRRVKRLYPDDQPVRDLASRMREIKKRLSSPPRE